MALLLLFLAGLGKPAIGAGCKPPFHRQADRSGKAGSCRQYRMITRHDSKLTDSLTVERWDLRNAAGASATVMALGATLLSLEAPDRSGALGNVVHGPSDVTGHASARRFMGPVAGRFANRIAGGAFVLDGQRYQLARNEGPNTLHGGPDGFDLRIWAGAEVETAEGPGLRLTLRSPDGDQGFPGNLDLAITYVWTDDFRLITDFTACSDRPTPFNPSLHAYWNLGPSLTGLAGHDLKVNACCYLPVDAGGIPAGGAAPVAGTRFDLRGGQALAGARGETAPWAGYDHCWAINGTGLREAAVLSHGGSGRVMAVITDQPGIQVYTANHFPVRPEGTQDPAQFRHCAVALETQHFPDSPNRPDFPDTVLRPGQVWHSRTVYAFSTC
jgi:aldose 1-epimerase